MSTKEQRIEHFNEHLSYELLMVRYTYSRIVHPLDQLLWNALFAAFAIYARNLYDFLRDENDSRNFKASDFILRFKANAEALHGIMSTLHAQVYHPGKRRTADPRRKVGVENIKKISSWIEANMAEFLSELEEPYKSAWIPERADLEAVMRASSSTNQTQGPTGPAATLRPASATSHVHVTKTKITERKK